MLLLRRILLSTISMFNTDNVSRGWLMSTVVLLLCICLQIMAQPFRKNTMDVIEFLGSWHPPAYHIIS